jgi:hypothetical protein
VADLRVVEPPKGPKKKKRKKEEEEEVSFGPLRVAKQPPRGHRVKGVVQPPQAKKRVVVPSPRSLGGGFDHFHFAIWEWPKRPSNWGWFRPPLDR